MSREEYEKERTEQVVKVFLDETFDKLFDPGFQVVLGWVPPQRCLSEQFERPSQWRVWKLAASRRYYRWIKEQNYPDYLKTYISEQIYNVLDEWPDPSWSEKRRKYKKRSK